MSKRAHQPLFKEKLLGVLSAQTRLKSVDSERKLDAGFLECALSRFRGFKRVSRP